MIHVLFSTTQLFTYHSQIHGDIRYRFDLVTMPLNGVRYFHPNASYCISQMSGGYFMDGSFYVDAQSLTIAEAEQSSLVTYVSSSSLS